MYDDHRMNYAGLRMRHGIDFAVEFRSGVAPDRRVNCFLSNLGNLRRARPRNEAGGLISHPQNDKSAAMIDQSNGCLGEYRPMFIGCQIEPTFVFDAQVFARFGYQRFKVLDRRHVTFLSRRYVFSAVGRNSEVYSAKSKSVGYYGNIALN